MHCDPGLGFQALINRQLAAQGEPFLPRSPSRFGSRDQSIMLTSCASGLFTSPLDSSLAFFFFLLSLHFSFLTSCLQFLSETYFFYSLLSICPRFSLVVKYVWV